MKIPCHETDNFASIIGNAPVVTYNDPAKIIRDF